jgi:NADPH:quinone reductase-like Zn-dependent oxidoreductase
MRAAQFSKYGGPEVVEFNPEAVLPNVKEGQVLVEAHAASLNAIDTIVRAGYMQAMLPLTLPVTVAGDFAGEVREVGPGVADLKPGDRVFGFAPVIAGGSGAAAEVVATNAMAVGRKPGAASYGEAAALPLAGVSAVQALEDYMKVGPDQKVLVHGGAGGVGSFAVQYAKHLGCHVATTVRGSQAGFARKIGADEVIDFELKGFETVVRNYDAVLDTVGGEVYKRSFATLKTGGVLASLVQNPPDQELAAKFGVRTVAVSAQVNAGSLNRLASLVEGGALKSQLDSEYPLERTREAFAHFESSHLMGKVVIRIK